jgi:hypothetical protein
LGRDIFQQRKCWLEELREYVKRKDSIICGAGCMSLPAITEEITEAAADPRPHTRQQRYDWKSRARDLDDTRAWLGRQLRAQVEPAASEVSRAITTDLLTPKPNGKVDLDDSKRPLVLAKVQALATLLERDHTISAAWQYLVAACQSSDHSLYPTERVKFLRDTVVALCSRREQDLGPSTRYAAHFILGDIRNPGELDVDKDADLTLGELEDLAARSVAAPSSEGDCSTRRHGC